MDGPHASLDLSQGEYFEVIYVHCEDMDGPQASLDLSQGEAGSGHNFKFSEPTLRWT